MCILTNPFSWPHFPVLPVIKRSGSRSWDFDPDACGLVFADPKTFTTIPTVYLCNLFDVAGKNIGELMKTTPSLSYDSLEELQKEWKVD